MIHFTVGLSSSVKSGALVMVACRGILVRVMVAVPVMGPGVQEAVAISRVNFTDIDFWPSVLWPTVVVPDKRVTLAYVPMLICGAE